MALEEADGALFAALRQQGLSSASSVSSLAGLEANNVFEICAESVKAINPNSLVPLKLTPNPSDRFRACSDLASEIKALGFKFEIGFQQILYPTVKEIRQILVFLADRFPKDAIKHDYGADPTGTGEEDSLKSRIRFALASACGEAKGEDAPSRGISAFNASVWYAWDHENMGPHDLDSMSGLETHEIYAHLVERATFERVSGKDCKMEALPLRLNDSDHATLGEKILKTAPSSDQERQQPHPSESQSTATSSQIEFGVYGSRQPSGSGSGGRASGVSAGGAGIPGETAEGEETGGEVDQEPKESLAEMRKRELGELHRRLVGLNQACRDLATGIESKRSEMEDTASEIRDLESKVRGLSGEHALWKDAVALAALHLEPGGEEKLSEALRILEGEMGAIQADLERKRREWDEMKAPVVAEIDRMRNVEAQKRDRRQKIAKEVADMGQKIRKLQIDLRHRKQEKARLQQDYKKADKSLNRYNYVQRIGEIIENVKKQEIEIRRILSDTLQVQRDINSAEESLHRAYSLADEVIFRQARSTKSVASKDLYQLLSEIHSNFASVTDMVRGLGKMDRETQDCIRKSEELMRTPFQDKITRARADLANLRKEMTAMENN